MPNIDAELNIIANEPKGALVKQAIHDALAKINDAANIRPPAKREVPIGQMINDTGYLAYWEIGSITPGEYGFQSDIRNSTVGSGEGNLAVSNSLYAANSGIAFVVAVNDWDENDEPTITDSSGTTLSWTQLTSVKAEMSMYDGGEGSQVKTDHPDLDFTIKGIIHSHDELPTTGVTDGDVYINPLDTTLNPPRPVYWYSVSEGALAAWGSGTAAGFKRTVEKRLTVWVAEIPSATAISVTVASYDSPVAIGAFCICDSPNNVVSDLPYRVCLIDSDGYHGVKAYDETLTYKGTVASVADLQNVTGETGDTYYVTNAASSSPGNYYNWDGSRWVADGTMYLSARDYIGQNETGVSEDTYKIFVCVSLVPTELFESPINPTSADSGISKAVCPTGESCVLSAWIQSASSTTKYPFNYMLGREYYRWVANGSVAILPLELGERSDQNGNSSD